MIRSAFSSKPTKRKCSICRVNAVANPMASVCSWQCALGKVEKDKEMAEADARRQSRAEDRKRKEELAPRKWWLKKAKAALHAFIRARDEGKCCISCDTILVKLGRVGGDYDAGHFRSVGSAKHMEFVEANISGQCKHCNDHLKGNPVGYERGLIARHGIEYVEALKNDNETRKLTIADFMEIEATYKLKLKELLVARAAGEAGE